MDASGDSSSKRAKRIFSSSDVGPVVDDVLYPLPHLSAVVAVQLVLNPPPVFRLGPLDTPLQAGTSHIVESYITRLESSVPLL